jgi:hypothetical protein
MSLELDSVMEKKDLMLLLSWNRPAGQYVRACARSNLLIGPHFALQTMAFALGGLYNGLDFLSFLHLLELLCASKQSKKNSLPRHVFVQTLEFDFYLMECSLTCPSITIGGPSAILCPSPSISAN